MKSARSADTACTISSCARLTARVAAAIGV
jgi:hypothetical protein